MPESQPPITVESPARQGRFAAEKGIDGSAGGGTRRVVDDDVVGNRRSFVMIGMIAVFAACVVFGVSRGIVTATTARPTPWWINILGAAVIGALYWWYRKAPMVRSSGAATGTAVVAVVALVVPVSYGMTSSIWWLGLIGFAMVLLGRRGEAWAWGVAIPLLVVVADALEPAVQVSGSAPEGTLERTLSRVCFVIILIAMVAGFRRVAETRAAELQASDERYRSLFQRVPVGIVHCDGDLRIKDCNELFADIVGGSRSGLIGGALGPLIEGRALSAIKDALRGEQGSYDGSWATTANGSERFISLRAAPLSRDDGTVAGALGILDDTTERRRMERQLQESHDELEHRVVERTRDLQRSREMLARVLDSIPQSVFWKDVEGRYLGCNRVFAQAAGLTDPSDIIGKNDYDLPWVEQADLYRADDREVIDTGAVKTGITEPLQHADGRRLWIATTKVPMIDESGATHGVLGVFDDITSRKRLEEGMRRAAAAMEQVAESIIITDIEGTIEYVNPAFTRITGYSYEEAVGRNPRILNSGEQRPSVFVNMWETLGRGEVWHGHLVNRRKDGDLFEADVAISPIRNDQGRVIHFVAVQRDVTQEMSLQAQLRQAQKQEALGRLAGGIAHDFNNLLQAMLSHVQLAQRDPSDGGREIADVEALIQRGASLARQLLLFSRPSSMRREPLDLNLVITDSGRLLRHLLRENVTFDVDPGDGPLVVEADHTQLDQVIMNLAVNAADAMPNGGRLTIRSGRSQSMAWIEVEDTGVGIPAEIQDKLFEPFFTTKAAGHGSGLGLSVVHGIIASHGGRVELTSEIGTGTRVRVFLPTTVGTAPCPRVGSTTGSSLPEGNGERLLLLEDEEAAREGLSDILEALGYKVTAFGTAGEAARLPVEPSFQVLVTDIMLPDLDGAAMALELVARWPGLAVVLMSGYSEDEALRHAAELGEVRFLQKPFDMATLATAVRAALDHERGRHESC